MGVEGANEVRMEATPVASLQTLEKQFMAQLLHKASETWNYPGGGPHCLPLHLYSSSLFPYCSCSRMCMCSNGLIEGSS